MEKIHKHFQGVVGCNMTKGKKKTKGEQKVKLKYSIKSYLDFYIRNLQRN